jgi:hypothetical protein
MECSSFNSEIVADFSWTTPQHLDLAVKRIPDCSFERFPNRAWLELIATRKRYLRYLGQLLGSNFEIKVDVVK